MSATVQTGSMTARSVMDTSGITLFSGDPKDWPAHMRALKSILINKKYCKAVRLEDGRIGEDDTASAADFLESRESCMPEPLVPGPADPPPGASKAVREAYTFDIAVWKNKDEATKKRNKSLQEAHSWALEILMASMRPEPARLTREMMASASQEGREVKVYDLVVDRSGFYTTSNPLMDCFHKLDVFLAPMQKDATSFKAWTVAAVRSFKEWEKSVYAGAAYPDGGDDRAAAWIVGWLHHQWNHAHRDSFPLPVKYREVFRNVLADQHYVALATFAQKLSFLENALTIAETNGPQGTGHPSVKQQQQSGFTARKEQSTSGAGTKSKAGPLSKTRMRAVLKQAGATKNQLQKVLGDETGRGPARRRVEATRSASSTSGKKNKNRQPGNAHTSKCVCTTACSCQEELDEDAVSGSEHENDSDSARGMEAIRRAPRAPAKRGTPVRGASAVSRKTRRFGLKAIRVRKVGKSSRPTEEGLNKPDRWRKDDKVWNVVLDSGAERSVMIDVNKASLAHDLTNIEEEGEVAFTATGEMVPIIAKASVGIMKDARVVKGVSQSLLSCTQLAEDGHWIIIPPGEANYDYGAYIVRDADRAVVGVADRDMALNLKDPVPQGMPPVQLPLLPKETTDEEPY